MDPSNMLPNDADDPSEHPVPYVRQAICEKCTSPLEGGWCRKCAVRRQVWTGLFLIFILPILSFGACMGAVSIPNVIIAPFIAFLCLLAVLFGPIMGVIFLVWAIALRRKKR